MPVTVQWDNSEQTIARYDFAERWTLEEFEAARTVGYDMITNASHQGAVGVLLVLAERIFLPENIITIVIKQVRVKNPRTFMVVVITKNSYIKVLFNILVTVYRPARAVFAHAETVEDGREILLTQREVIHTPNN
jgi:hypothetical protein